MDPGSSSTPQMTIILHSISLVVDPIRSMEAVVAMVSIKISFKWYETIRSTLLVYVC